VKPEIATWLRSLPHSGQAAGLLRSVDWSATPIGPFDQWPASLRNAVSLILKSRFPMLVCWGPSLVQIYNDAYIPIYGSGCKHPRAYGARVADTWVDIYDVVGPMMHGVLRNDSATWSEDQLLLIDRLGFPEDTYFTFSYSPITDETGRPGGLLSTAVEMTSRVIEARRARTLGELAALPIHAGSVADVAQAFAQCLRGNADLPFVLIYLAATDGLLQLSSATGLEPGSAFAPAFVAPGDSGPWPLLATLADGQPRLIEGLTDRLATESDWGPAGPPRSARLMAMPGGTDERPLGVLVAGLSPRRRIDPAYEMFLNSVAARLATSIAISDDAAHRGSQ